MVYTVVLLLLFPATTLAYYANVTSNPEIVYNWTAQHCANGLQPWQWDVPDAPARAFNVRQSANASNTNRTYLLASVDLGSRANFASISDFEGAEVSQMNHSCHVYYNSTLNYNVSMFSDHEWIAATYIMPDQTGVVYGLVHMEFHGWSDATPKCTDPFPSCWYNVITSVVSYDAGAHWQYLFAPPLHLSAALPYQYFYNQPMFGWRSPSNILYSQQDNYYYATITTQGYGLQMGGTAIMRTHDLSSNSWQCYNSAYENETQSRGFNVNISDNPYANSNGAYNISQHICTIITNSTYPTLLWSAFYQQFMMVGTNNGYDTGGYAFTLSSDLVHWGEWSVIRKGYPWNSTYNEIYPSFIDPKCTLSDNYDCVAADTGYLYYIVSKGEYNGALIRDIYRQQVQFF